MHKPFGIGFLLNKAQGCKIRYENSSRQTMHSKEVFLHIPLYFNERKYYGKPKINFSHDIIHFCVRPRLHLPLLAHSVGINFSIQVLLFGYFY